MNVRYQIARAMAPGARLTFDAQRQEIMPADVLIALGWVRRTCPQDPMLAGLMLRVKYGLQWQDFPHLLRRVHALAGNLFARRGWLHKPLAGDLFDRFVAQLTVEWFESICKHCRGRGYDPQRPHFRCPECNGTNAAKVSNRERAEALDVAETTFRRHRWEDRFHACREELDEIERRACSKMHYHLRG